MWVWALIPGLMAVIGTVGIWSGCLVAVENGSVNITERFPFISDCADHYPQGPFINLVSNTACILGLCITVIRFLLVRSLGNHEKTNIAGIVFGFFFSLGFLLVGNFQKSQYLNIHIVASMMLLFGCAAFFWTQLFLIYWTKPPQSPSYIAAVMAICNTINTILVIGHYSLDPSYGAICELFFMTMFFLMFGLYIPGFRHIEDLRLTEEPQALKNDHGPALAEKLRFCCK